MVPHLSPQPVPPAVQSLPEAAALRREAWLQEVVRQSAATGAQPWSEAAVAAAALRLGFDRGEQKRLAPEGAIELLLLWFGRADQAAIAVFRTPELAGTKIREKVRNGTIAWLAALHAPGSAGGPARKAQARHGFSFLMARGRFDFLTQIHWRAADAVWTGLGDPSLDGNYYSKRGILAGVLAATIPVWIAADDDTAAFAFLDRRIAGIMRFEKFKADARAATARWPKPMDVLSGLRYPRN